MAFPPDAGDRHDRRAPERESMPRLRVTLARALEESVGGNEAAIALVETSSYRAEIEHRTALGPDGGKLKFIGTTRSRYLRRASPDPCR